MSYFFDSRVFFFVLRKYIIRIIFFLILVFFLGQLGSCHPVVRTPLLWVRRPFVLLTGKPNTEKLWKYQMEVYEDYQDPQPNRLLNWGGYQVRNTFLKRYKVWGKVGYLDINDSLIKGWYLNAGDEGSAAYKKVAPYDLCLLFGRLARDENFNNVKVKHEENVCIPELKKRNVYYNSHELSNYHIIFPKPSIRRVLKSLKYGDEIQIEGFLAHWKGIGPLSYLDFKSATYAGEKYPYLYGGRSNAELCKQIYITKIIWKNRVFE